MDCGMDMGMGIGIDMGNCIGTFPYECIAPGNPLSIMARDEFIESPNASNKKSLSMMSISGCCEEFGIDCWADFAEEDEAP
jgi:hypothetical protein